jgi:hypothetical protein
LNASQVEFRDWSTPSHWLVEARDTHGGVVPVLAVTEVQRTLEHGGGAVRSGGLSSAPPMDTALISNAH